MRLLIHVERQTEETFVNEVLAPHLSLCGFHLVSPRILGNARIRGGIRPWPSVRRDIVNHLNEDRACVTTTMVDYYGLPQSKDGAWPGRANSSTFRLADRASVVQAALFEDVKADVIRPERFVPFVLMHEFEALLFSDCQLFSRGIGRADLQPQFEAIRSQFSTPEEINDSPDTAPSQRILHILPSYQKPLFGNLAVLEIGLLKIRRECPHFDRWLSKLESLPAIAPAPLLR